MSSDSEALAKAIGDFCASHSWPDNPAAIAADVHGRFSWATAAQALSTVYDDVVSKKRSLGTVG